MKKITILIAFLGMSSLANASPNLVLNGSFEADSQGAGTWSNYTNLTDWVGGEFGIELRNNVAGAASNGVNFVELDTTQNSSMYQNISTSLGSVYNLSFDYSPRENISSESNPIQVLWNGVQVTEVTGTGGPSGNNWITYDFKVTGTGGLDQLKFVATGISDSYGGSLDNVVLTAVPEPETYAMLLAGLGLVGFTIRRTKNEQV
jgi:hypothetical protein